ncbi:MAG: hydrogenase formation protein HypD [Candidatus Hadarchaeales archaeon]
MFRFRDRETAGRIVEELRKMGLNLFLMHVCGTHQDTLVRYGLDRLLEPCGVKIRQGPGCPVCVTTQREIEEALVLARRGKLVATFGDMVGVPGESGSLAGLRGEGADVRIVYSIRDAVGLAEKTGKEVVFLAIGFETTAPSTAVTLLRDPPPNFSVLCCHRYIPPAIRALLDLGETRVQGLIEPGHVSTVIGTRPYEEIAERYRLPQVVAGFEPLDLLMGVYLLARMIQRGEVGVRNEYTRSVRPEGNVKALKVMDEVFEPVDVDWRGFPVIPGSGMALREEFEEHDARKRYEDELRELEGKEFKPHPSCRCDRVLRGLLDPPDCPLFGKVCTPRSPVGPCMVSSEGSCAIEYKYGRRPAG